MAVKPWKGAMVAPSDRKPYLFIIIIPHIYKPF